jgi:hypothetical protein
MTGIKCSDHGGKRSDGSDDHENYRYQYIDIAYKKLFGILGSGNFLKGTSGSGVFSP